MPPTAEPMDQHLIAEFRTCGKYGNGKISKSEVAHIFKSLDPEHWTDEKVSRLLQGVPSDSQDDSIQYEQLFTWIFDDTACTEQASGGGFVTQPPTTDKIRWVHSHVHALLQGFGEDVFKGAVADKYLAQVGMPSGTIEKGEWTRNPEEADKVAQAVTAWATDRDATVFCHWFQPLGSGGVRHGMSAMVQQSFFQFNALGQPVYDLKGKHLLFGETDGSSYPHGGLRATHTAGGYLTIDPTSPMWLRGDALFIPACFSTFHGDAIDEKIPLLRSAEALSREGKRLFKLLGVDVPGFESKIGLEQEFFLVPRDATLKRPDLQMCGRTLIGKDAPRGQEMCDHYMGPLNSSTPALDCLREIQRQCFKMGIPMKTRHREVAPNQFEMAPLFGTVTTQIDQNLIVMQIAEEVAIKYGLTCLFQEKPFNNVNGSGKHNNWSVWSLDGTNLMDPAAVAKKSGKSDTFPIVFASLIKSLDKHGDLMRMAIASPGNDFRLGACEAPPAILSTYLGEALTNYLEGFRNGKDVPYDIQGKMTDLGISCLPSLQVPAEDRNRTSPFPYGGLRFEFRAAGSSQNTSLVNTVLNSITAAGFKEFADAIEAGKAPRDVAVEALNNHWKVIFNGNGYDPANQQMLTEKGVWRIDSGVEAMCRMTDEKNVKLFSDIKVLSPAECASRQSINLEYYTGFIEIEAKTMIDLINQHVIPSVKKANMGDLAGLEQGVVTIQKALAEIAACPDEKAKATLARTLRLETMVNIRAICDAAEAVVPAELWTLATYKDLLFLEATTPQ
eukprot:gnl/TRDRNA2_/TRDRNA2_177940_c0_seq4.p1 gnl/TRDRNA2_/TRDRNA2_177940_c0~~gnl/TRDRNA2_/TRDRNA2_177940_c0_seq4.p1  ORF type:complete len:784 (-),score=167.94 gnl/TRDRNA2_/TRDRNA2_177940_c0_seq4:86-2437(-)